LGLLFGQGSLEFYPVKYYYNYIVHNTKEGGDFIMEDTLRAKLEDVGVDVAKGIQINLGNAKMFDKIFNKVIRDTSIIKLFELENSVDHEQIFDISHGLKGTLANAGLVELDALVTDICETTRAGKLDGVKENIVSMRESYNKIISCLDE